MTASYRAPGVYREDVFLSRRAPLATGIAAFVGFAARTAAGGAPGTPLSLDRAEEFGTRCSVPASLGGFLQDAVRGFFANGGVRCHVIDVAPEQVSAEALMRALERLDAFEEPDLIAVPDAMLLAETSAVQRVQRAVLDHCLRVGQRFAILDAPGGAVLEQFLKERDGGDLALALPEWRQRIAQDDRLASNAALYHPWVQVTASAAGGRPVPPCGHVAGVFARSDARIGVFKPPANEEIFNAVDFESRVDQPLQQELNPVGINCLRAFPGRGLRVYGARTLSRDPAWCYIHVRRLFQMLSRWIDRNMAWAAFEPNTPRLWLRIQRELNGYLDGLWQAGALRGATAAEAFYVKCDAETNPPAEREQGRVFTDIGLAVAQPAEFVVVRIVHRPGSSA